VVILPTANMREKMTIREAILFCKEKLVLIYDENECQAISETLLEFLLQKNKIQLKLNTSDELNLSQINLLNEYLERLQKNEPLQYILNEAWFDNSIYKLNKNVLIPRPETEELLYLILKAEKDFEGKIIDFGTGSGCLAISLKKHLKDAEIIGIDISKEALETAKINAQHILGENNSVQFIKKNMLDYEQLLDLPTFEMIVSNPPYIDVKEKEKMHENVWKHEPLKALFAPENDVLIFYKAIEKFATEKLAKNGKIYLEINPLFASETEEIFSQKKYKTELKSDMQGKQRFLIVSG